MDGIIIIDKPQGMTSHDVVGFVRRLTGVRKVGHTGTLDPMATGVLPICVGKATRIIEFIDMDNAPDAKGYDCEMRLGVRSDTLDVWGNVYGGSGASESAVDGDLVNASGNAIDGDSVGALASASASVSAFASASAPASAPASAVPKNSHWSVPSEKEIRDSLAALVGDVEQVPPAYSAIKYKGRKLYDMARRGEEIPQDAVKPRKVHIESVEVTGIEFDEACDCRARDEAKKMPSYNMSDGSDMRDEPTETGSRFGFATVRFSVACSKGTYVRSIVRDVGETLGCGAVMSALRRTKSGVFTLADAHPISTSSDGKHELSQGVVASDVLLPIDAAIPYLPSVDVDKAAARKFVNGIQIAADSVRAHTDSTESVSAMDRKSDSVKIIGSALDSGERMYVKVYGEGVFIGVGKIRGGIIKPYKVIMA